MTLCATCRKANKSCVIYPQDTQHCVEYKPMMHDWWNDPPDNYDDVPDEDYPDDEEE